MAKGPRKKPKKTKLHDDDLEDILLQCACAFGVGTGGVRVRRTALRLLRDHYADVFRETMTLGRAQWRSTQVKMLYLCKVTGQLAAGLAVREGGGVIEEEHVIAARDRVVTAMQRREQMLESGEVRYGGMFCLTDTNAPKTPTLPGTRFPF